MVFLGEEKELKRRDENQTKVAECVVEDVCLLSFNLLRKKRGKEMGIYLAVSHFTGVGVEGKDSPRSCSSKSLSGERAEDPGKEDSGCRLPQVCCCCW